MSTPIAIPKQHLQEVHEDLPPNTSSSSQKNSNSKNPTSHIHSTEDTSFKEYVEHLPVDNRCKCPHLEAHLPTFLDSGGFGLSSILSDDSAVSIRKLYPRTFYNQRLNKVSKSRTISDVHFESLLQNYDNDHHEFDDVATAIDGGINSGESNSNHTYKTNEKNESINTKDLKSLSKLYPFGEEEMKTDMIAAGGIAPHYNPMFTNRFMQQTQNQRFLSIFEMQENSSGRKQLTDKGGGGGGGGGGVEAKFNNHTFQNGPQEETYEEKFLTIIKHRNELFGKLRSGTDGNNSKTRKKKLTNLKKRSRSDTNSSNNSNNTKTNTKTKTDPTINSIVSSSSQSSCGIIDNQTNQSLQTSSDLEPNPIGKGHSSKSEMIQRLIKNQEQNVENAVAKVEHWLEVIAENQNRYWKNNLLQRKYYNHDNNDDNDEKEYMRRKMCFGEITSEENRLIDEYGCKYCTKMMLKRKRSSETKKKTPPLRMLSGDCLIQCLDCGIIACGGPYASTSNDKVSNRLHISQHFLISGHKLGITCGPKGSIISSGDVVYHPVLEREKERIAILHNAKWLGWQRHGITRRSFGFSHQPQDDFVFIPDSADVRTYEEAVGSNGTVGSMAIQTGMVIWRGFRALYPPEVPPALIEAGKKTLQRVVFFHLHTRDVSTLKPSSQVANLATVGDMKAKTLIPRPIGLYNMGNTCYLGCVLQCIINLPPIQKYFLNEVKHDHRSCAILRSYSAKNKNGNRKGSGDMRVCIGCEMDKLYLAYFGSANGLDVQKVLTPDIRKDSVASQIEEKGVPLSPTDILVELWKCKSMSLLVGYEQRDAHEFLQMFLDILSKHCRQFHEEANHIRQRDYTDQIKKNLKLSQHLVDGDIVKKLFGGTLRSVLICQKCGFKRSQKEAFLNISIPLDKQLTSGNDEAFLKQNEPTKTRPRSLRNQIDLLACLQKFVSPESLSDPLNCPWCKEKTKTLKQHTFANFPKILCLHLKRFDAAKNRKIDEPVSYPTGLNMGAHFPQWQEIMQKDVIQKKHLSSSTTDDNSTHPDVLYDLLGTIDHTGSLNQGHYTSSVKVADQWYRCNDAFVSKSSTEEVLCSKEAYMLFYVLK